MHIKLGSDQYGVCNNYTLAGGREMSYLDVEKTNAVCVLGAGAKEALFDFTDPVGEYITINGQPFKVVGYYEAVDLEGWNGAGQYHRPALHLQPLHEQQLATSTATWSRPRAPRPLRRP